MNKKILYVFGPGRKTKLTNNSYQAREFFYGYQHFEKKYDVDIIEVIKEELNKEGFRKLIHFYDRLIVKLTNFPSYSVELITRKNIKNYKKFDFTVFTSDALFLSFLPIVLINKILRRKNRNIVITMGLFGKTSSNRIKKIFNFIYLKLIIFSADKFILLGYGEYKFVKANFKKYSKKFEYLPFSVDKYFWSQFKTFDKDGVLFVGNDGKRDYELLKNIILEMKEINFTVITNQNINIEVENLNTIKGNWSKQLITDEELRDYYSKSKLTIIPLKESFQPSGQSVALQSIACNTPVLVSDTSGFWGDEEFINQSKIEFVKNNNIKEWKSKIYELLDKNKTQELTRENLTRFYKEYDIEIFNSGLEKIILSYY